jgi:HSP20 family protein
MPNNDKKNKSRRPQDDEPTDLAIPTFGFPRVFQDYMKPFDELMGSFFQNPWSLWGRQGGKEPTIDFQDRGDHFVFTAELPGFEKKEVEVKVSAGGLELKAEKTTRGDGKNQQTTSREYYHRYLAIPEEVRTDKVSGTMKNGVLELKLPKAEPTARDNSRRVDLK